LNHPPGHDVIRALARHRLQQHIVYFGPVQQIMVAHYTRVWATTVKLRMFGNSGKEYYICVYKIKGFCLTTVELLNAKNAVFWYMAPCGSW
jgi:hypothetical protein